MDDYSRRYLASLPADKALQLLEKCKPPSSQKTAAASQPCPKCQSDDTVTREVQLRRADEGSSLVVQCMACGTRTIF